MAVSESHYRACAHELVYTWANKEDGTIDRMRLTDVVAQQLKAHYQVGFKEGREEAIDELKTDLQEAFDDVFGGPHVRCSNCRGNCSPQDKGYDCEVCKDKGYVQHGLE